jgi:hypothetical protein
MGALLIGIALLALCGGLPTLIVYRRNQGRLSWRASRIRAFFHFMRVFGWTMIGLQIVLFVPLWATDRLELSHWGYPWWAIFPSLAFAGFGYGFQRLGKFLLRDEDLKNMIGRGIE